MSQAEKFLDLPLEEVIGDRFGRYSKYIIQDRALPDVRDGLKPVQRRILYAMHQDGNTAEKPYRKSAKTVGNVIGNFHPHGDSSVYEAMVRMSQSWKVRYNLIEMHGNNGSIDGDPPAAMRYTEARLSSITTELLRDIEKQTVEFAPNFDDTTDEPVVLPAMYPNLLVNGSTGISAGYATEIPPHQLGEVIDAVIMQLEKPDCSLEQLMTVIKGPDFPTGGIVQGIEGIKKAYETGKGRIIVRGVASIETLRGGREQITITEIPADVNKANLVKKMDELRLDRKLEGIAEVRDETDRTGLRIVIELRKDANADGILNYLYKNTDLQVTYNFNMVAIYNKTPQLMGLKKLLKAYIDHQKEVVTNRSRFDLHKAKERLHVVEGLVKAISILDEVIATIRESKDKRDSKNRLSKLYGFTEPQAEAIVTLQLYRLTNTDVKTLQKEASELEKKIKQLESILKSESKLISVIKKELADVKKKYNDERKTKIEDAIEEIKINLEVVVPKEDVIATVTKDGYVKRTSLRSYSASNFEDLGMKESDRLLRKLEINTTETLLLFTNKGNFIYLPVHMLPDIRWKEPGQHVSNFITFDENEKIIEAIGVSHFTEDLNLLFLTKNGFVKQSVLSLYKAQRFNRALMGIRLKDDDEVINVYVTKGNEDLLLATKQGYSLRFNLEEVNPIGLRALGVKGINLKENDQVVGGIILDENVDFDLLVVTHRFAVKKMPATRFERSKRARRGVAILRELKANPHEVIAFIPVTKFGQLNIRTEKGEIVKIHSSTLRLSDLQSNGSFVADSKKIGAIIDVWVEEIALEE
ncbi:DNA topoisomerase IV subunit A [Pueribacillus theae]|uniref:DNA topoisomerase 4 subunit A n=1 Tax=Pueribacillus theae TaxID=2171751 RepID=A0A2U1JUL1_9BACI|nr:DNA topoisomerase IV subunit A [Pueribacillus theae]PWA08891.1 DNA topoisomerase IV subunit A [Pueribacillus theae]